MGYIVWWMTIPGTFLPIFVIVCVRGLLDIMMRGDFCLGGGTQTAIAVLGSYICRRDVWY